MELRKKVYHSQVFRDCIGFFENNNIIGTSIKSTLSFGYKFLQPIEMYLETNNNPVSKNLIYLIKESLDNNQIYSDLEIYSILYKKINNYIKNNKFSKKPLEYYSWILDALINQINKDNDWNEMVEKIHNDYVEDNNKQVFLSYSSIDKALTFWMYQYFKERSVFLYVDWMFGKYYDSGIDSKRQLENELLKSTSFLYLRTLNSEISGGKYTRSWCGWEIGRSYQYHTDKQYHCDDFAVPPILSPNILDGFKEFLGFNSISEL